MFGLEMRNAHELGMKILIELKVLIERSELLVLGEAGGAGADSITVDEFGI